MPETTTLNPEFVADVLAQIAENEPELIQIGSSLLALGGERYAIAIADDAEESLWLNAVQQLDTLAPGQGDWLVTESVSFGPALVSYLQRSTC